MEAEEKCKTKKQEATEAERGKKGAIKGPAPWPAAGGKREYIAHVLEDTPLTLAKRCSLGKTRRWGTEERKP